MNTCLRTSVATIAVLLQSVLALAAAAQEQPAQSKVTEEPRSGRIPGGIPSFYLPSPSAEKKDYGLGGPEGLLYWLDGGSLPGQPAGVEGTHLLWKSRLFTEPLSIDMRQIERMRFGPVASRLDALEHSDDNPFEWELWSRAKGLPPETLEHLQNEIKQHVPPGLDPEAAAEWERKTLAAWLAVKQPQEEQFSPNEKAEFALPGFLSDKRHHLVYASTMSTGTVVVEKGVVQWRPHGGSTPCSIVPGRRVRFLLNTLDTVKPYGDGLFDKLIMVGGDVWPCRIEGFEDASLRVTLPFGDPRSVPFESVKAVEFASLGAASVGFDAIDWEAKSYAKRPFNPPAAQKMKPPARFFEDENKVVLQNAAALTSPRFEAAGPHGTRFTVDWSETATIHSWLACRWINGDWSNVDDCLSVSLILDKSQRINVYVVEESSGERPTGEDRFVQYIGRWVQLDPDLKARVSIEASDHGITRIVINEEEIFNANEETISLSVAEKEASANNRSHRIYFTKRPYSRLQLLTDSRGGAVLSDLKVRAPTLRFNTGTLRYLLTVPRFLRDDPPTHVLLAGNGDPLRGQFLGADEEHIRFQSGKNELEFDRSNMAGLVWLHSDDERQEPVGEQAPSQDIGDNDAEIGIFLAGNNRIFMKPEQTTDDALIGQVKHFGRCSIPLESIVRIGLGDHGRAKHIRDYSDWVASYAINPRWDEIEAGSVAAGALVGKKAPPTDLPLVDGTRLTLPDPAGRVVVLDFWASWCAPCMNAMPEYVEALSGFDPAKVRFVAINQGESAEVVKDCLDKRDWDVTVALDADEAVAKKFQVNAIPHTVVLGPDGTIRWSSTGSRSNTADQLRRVVSELLEQP